MNTFITKLPKAELHLHIEGTFEPELMFEIANRNQISIPYKSVNELKEAYRFDCLQDFLDIYYQGASVLIKEQDFYDLTMSYLKKCKEQGIIHAEIMFDPQTHTHRGVSFDTVIEGIHAACADAQKNMGISTVLIMSYLRHLDEEDAFETLREGIRHKDKIKAIGLDSSELGHPPSKFKRVYEASVKEGFIPVAHAGEEGPPEYIWEALNLLHIKRIDHGNNCLKDPDLVKEIINRDLALTVCPLSNIALKVVDHLDNHPLKEMMDLGLKVTVNSDDPAYFGGYLNDNYEAIGRSLDLDEKQITALASNAFNYALINDDLKQQYLDQLEVYYKEWVSKNQRTEQ